MNDMKITKLTGPDRVRKRPGVIFAADDVIGAQRAVQELLYIFVREALLGYCKHLNVKQKSAYFEIQGDDRGIDLGQDTGDNTKWESIFCGLIPGPKYRPDESEYSLELIDDTHYMLYGENLPKNAIYFPGDFGYMELYALQCVCKHMDVLVNRNGLCSKLHFECGRNIGGIHNEKTSEKNGSSFQFELDDQVFTQTNIPEDYIISALDSYAFLVPGLSCTYESASGYIYTFFYPDGISDYVQKEAPQPYIPAFRKKLQAKGRNRYNLAEYNVCVDIAIGYTPNNGRVQCYHNFKALTYGGTHLEKLKKQLCDALNLCYWKSLEEAGAKELTFEEIAPHLTIVLASWCPSYCSMYENNTGLSIQNPVITDMTEDAMKPYFENYIHDHKKTYQKLVDAVLNNRK